MSRALSATQKSVATASRMTSRRYASAVATPSTTSTLPNSEAYLDIAKVPIASVEVAFNSWTKTQQKAMIERIAELQKQDWKTLSLEEKRAAFYVSFGPHSARTPYSLPGDSTKVVFGVASALGLSAALFAFIRSFSQETPRTMNPEWQEATNEYLREQKANPISGISSEGYQGKGFVTTK
ncbi:cytochrome c oxidase [Dimargaris cristalligena]|uniref:Cytochrome c oxidase subunit IV-domain-containing protein n=1 Tax=Dimargaris cristalligena TaxID=215637 RepID=A0A4P9ZYJ1_9FUNG|nr:cytochrome c oxidase [Dimargaris cristalligena]RKP38012.1 cytochrome c oxidase subunit IV-domain-containing protein [Dimargaris cristalligena]|eukprot:RKP38012.1 cytochrome c oxidase subunit IV-domain-containing protein [Dimargaris cristalligena]